MVKIKSMKGFPLRFAVLLAVFLLFTFPVSASMVSFLMVETGIGEETSAGQYSSLWEGGLMDVFFDAGHIVTNSPVTRMEKIPSEEISGRMEVEFYEALYSGADFFIVGFLEYQFQD